MLPIFPAESRDVKACGVVVALVKTKEENEVRDFLRIEPAQTEKLRR